MYGPIKFILKAYKIVFLFELIYKIFDPVGEGCCILNNCELEELMDGEAIVRFTKSRRVRTYNLHAYK